MQVQLGKLMISLQPTMVLISYSSFRYFCIFLKKHNRKLRLYSLVKCDVGPQKHVNFGFLMHNHIFSLDIHRSYIFRQKQKSSNNAIVDIINGLLINNFNENIGRFSQILTQHLHKLFLIFFHMYKGTIFLQP